MAENEELRASIDGVKAAILVLTDKLSASMQEMDAATSALSATALELRSRGEAARLDVPEALSALPPKVDALLAAQGRVVSELESLSHACSQMPMHFEAVSQMPRPEHVAAISGAVGSTVEEKLVQLAKLEAELLSELRKSNESLAALSSQKSSLPEAASAASPTDSAGVERLNRAVDKIIENQNRQNEVLAETLSALLDAVSHIKGRVDLMPSQGELEKEVEKDIARKIAEA